MQFEFKEENDFTYLDEGEGEVLLLLHGLFGALSNWTDVILYNRKKYRVIIPMLPIYTAPLKKASVSGLAAYVDSFINHIGVDKVTLLGNSLGGHVGLVYALEHSDKVERLVLTGSSGLFESGMGSTFPKRGNYDYIKERVEYTFYDPNTATKELVDEVFGIINSNQKAIRIISIAKSAQRHNMAEEISKIKKPTLLVWGLNDTITPPEVAHEFDKLMPNSELHFVDKCGHAPMMEQSNQFNDILDSFLENN